MFFRVATANLRQELSGTTMRTCRWQSDFYNRALNRAEFFKLDSSICRCYVEVGMMAKKGSDAWVDSLFWRPFRELVHDAAVAQLAEHHVANVIVVGSNPISRSFLFPPSTPSHSNRRSGRMTDRDEIVLPWPRGAPECCLPPCGRACYALRCCSCQPSGNLLPRSSSPFPATEIPFCLTGYHCAVRSTRSYRHSSAEQGRDQPRAKPAVSKLEHAVN